MENAKRSMPNCLLMRGAAVLAAVAAGLALAQDASPEAPAPASALRAELRAVRPVYTPEGAVRLRFTLINTSEQPVDIPLDYPLVPADGVALPQQLVLGSGEQRLVSVIYEAEAPKEVPAPPAPARMPEGVRTLRLAPHGALGTELDLREYFPALRYAGTYRVEWQPLEGRLGVLSAELRVEPRKDAILVTDRPGKITFVLDYEGAPQNVENFLELVREGFYSGKTFHRVIPSYLIQAGCPKGDGTGTRPDNKLVPAEFRDIPVEAGTLGMAHKDSDPNSASCQFFIALTRLPELDGKYTVIGQARDEGSLRTLRELAETPTDRRDRPLSPLTIRSINLVSAEESPTRDLRMRHPRSAGPERAAEKVPTSQPTHPQPPVP